MYVSVISKAHDCWSVSHIGKSAVKPPDQSASTWIELPLMVVLLGQPVVKVGASAVGTGMGSAVGVCARHT